MKALDFEYDGILASEKGYVPCDFDDTTSDQTVNYGSQIKFDTTVMRNGKSFELVNSSYDEPDELTFQICKDPEKFIDKCSFTTDEQRFIYRWLNRNDGFHFLKIVTTDGDSILFYGSFNIETIEFCGGVVGFELTFTLGKPYGTKECKTITHTFTANEQFTIIDESDDIGYIYPDVTIKCKSNGNLTITNSIENRKTVIKNCTANEVISVDSHLNMYTSLSSHKIYNDFNFVFFRIANTYANNKNIISVNIPCEITIKYYPVAKGVGL